MNKGPGSNIPIGGGRRPPPFSLRLTANERAELERMAGSMSLSSYIKGRLFDSDAPAPRRRRRRGVKDEKALRQLLAMLGSSRLSQNMNQLAKAAHVGNLPLRDQVERDALIAGQLDGRRALQQDVLELRERQRDERADLAADIGAALKLEGRKAAYQKQMRRSAKQERQRRRGFDR